MTPLEMSRHEAEMVLSLLSYARRLLPEGASAERVLGLVEGFARGVADTIPRRSIGPSNGGPPMHE